MPYIAYLFHLLIIPTRAAGNPELEAALPYQQIYLETVLAPRADQFLLPFLLQAERPLEQGGGGGLDLRVLGIPALTELLVRTVVSIAA